MSVLDKICIKLTSQFIAEDKLGNRYYESKRENYLGMKARYVLYNGSQNEPSSVQPLFHAWLHHLTKEIDLNSKDFFWQNKNSKPLLDSKVHYYSKLNNVIKRKKVSADYQPFQQN